MVFLRIIDIIYSFIVTNFLSKKDIYNLDLFIIRS